MEDERTRPARQAPGRNNQPGKPREHDDGQQASTLACEIKQQRARANRRRDIAGTQVPSQRDVTLLRPLDAGGHEMAIGVALADGMPLNRDTGSLSM